eukprot:1152256-Pelagomonas_calceolata.AAC.2
MSKRSSIRLGMNTRHGTAKERNEYEQYKFYRTMFTARIEMPQANAPFTSGLMPLKLSKIPAMPQN